MYIAMALAAGAGLAFQAVINSRLRMVLGSALWAAFVQVLVGLVFLAVVVTIARDPAPGGGAIARAPWWAWTGGILGSFFVLTAIVATVPLGAALTMALVVVGQTLAALIIDHYGWFGLEVQRLSPLRLLGALLLVSGVALMRLR
jgi:transporter family-2 protein